MSRDHARPRTLPGAARHIPRSPIAGGAPPVVTAGLTMLLTAACAIRPSTAAGPVHAARPTGTGAALADRLASVSLAPDAEAAGAGAVAVPSGAAQTAELAGAGSPGQPAGPASPSAAPSPPWPSRPPASAPAATPRASAGPRSYLVSADGAIRTPVGDYGDCTGQAPVPRYAVVVDTCVRADTYFAGHNPGTFTPLMSMGVGARFTWWDASGTPHPLRIVAVRDWLRSQGIAPRVSPDVVAQFQTCVTADGSVDRVLDAVPA